MKFLTSFFHKHKESDHQDSVDYITGLMGRRDCERKIKAAMAEEPGCLAFIDLDNLKPINDMFGHHAGDHAIRVVSDVLKEHGQEAIISRIGGDEFLFYMKDVNEGKASFIIDCIMTTFNRKREQHNTLNVASLSIGLCLTTPLSTYSDVYRKADKALYFIKQNGKDAYYFYHHAFANISQKPTVNLTKLIDSIRRQGSYEGALGVEYREFTHLYEYINNLSQRYNYNLHLVMISLKPLSSVPGEFTPDMLEEAMSHMNKTIRTSLRNIDVCTRFNSQQFLIILNNTTEENISLVMNRLSERFHELYPSDAYQLHYEIAHLGGTDTVMQPETGRRQTDH